MAIVTNNPFILCFKLLGVSLGKVNKAPMAIVRPVSSCPKYEKTNTGIIAERTTLKAL